MCRDRKLSRTRHSRAHEGQRLVRTIARSLALARQTWTVRLKDSVAIEKSLSRQTYLVVNSALCYALFELLFMDTIHGHCSQEVFLKLVSNLVGLEKKRRKKRSPNDLGRHSLVLELR